MKWFKDYTLFFILMVCLPSCHPSPGNGNHDYYRVTRVIDGDTFWIDDGTEKGRKVRLIGVDAPETRRTSGKKVGLFGVESKNYLTALLLGKDVRLEFDVERTDRYGRTLAYVYLRDSTFVNAELLEHGFGMVMTVPPNVKYSGDFLQLQIEAREKEKGLWKK